ncbi:hypothetical protein EGN72_02220 [Pseudorhodobacter sp. E13]|uniref:hypothetical protein n=1 Tax=Pseudorhodobacter sp. E13 TaxID=2487931 RepID=UPI000F8D9A71|nr:hypothetical protein [Pseudorhodobacter sp. E13]RUS64921.1 hypothetical protein EGN72_02220 [Pseudorhodobacter sp. E13]
MQLIADILLAAGAFGAAVYCYILAQRLKRLQTLETGMGGAIAVLSAQVDDMTKALETARGAADNQVQTLEAITDRGEAVATRLELLLASMHDLPAEQKPAGPPARASAVSEEEPEKRLRFVRRRPAQDALEAAE